MKSWFETIEKKSKPFVIAGPCSAESELQLLTVAKKLKVIGIAYMRAGVWKPRTRPGSFEGKGEVSLKWLKGVKEQTGINLATEVVNAKHVELALKNHIDLLWIGARTSVNPFAVDEIAQALRGTNKIVMVKNPVSPDLALWIGAVERLVNSNIKKIGIIHRGFSSFYKTPYRNSPEWRIALDIKLKFPNLPLICDPSHISGTREKIAEISQTALNLNYQGLMIEAHPNPAEALSDAEQQLSLEQLADLMKGLKMPLNRALSQDYQKRIDDLRFKIDVNDQAIFDLLLKRMGIAKEIGLLKKENNLSILQVERWQELLKKMKVKGNTYGFSPNFTEQVFKIIHQESILQQNK